MGRGKCGRAILGSLGKVTSAGSDKDVIRTCFPGHILHCGETSPTQSCCHKLSASLLCTPGQGKLEKPVNPWLAGAREGYLQSAATAFVWLRQQRSSTSHQCSGGSFWVLGGFHCPAQPTPEVQVLQTGVVLPWQRHSRPPSTPGHGVWVTLPRSHHRVPVPSVGQCLSGADVLEDRLVGIVLTHPNNALLVLSRVMVK